MSKEKVDITIHAGHNTPTKKGCGAVGILDESEYTRRVLKVVKQKLKKHGISFKDITVENANNATDVLQKLAKRENECLKKINISLHLNCFNKTASGTEVLFKVKKPKSAKYFLAMKKIHIKKRGNIKRDNLYIMNRFNAPTFLLELGFCDNANDSKALSKDIEKVASAIAWFIIKNIKGVKKWQ
mgnify:CR=1 FL=1